jgi:hypothetical protein
MASQTPEQIAQAWASRLGQSTQKITDGVNAVKVAPGLAASRQKAVWLAQVQANQDKWAKNTAAVTLPEWQQAMIEKGAPRIAQGATASVDKFAGFMGQLLPHIDRVKGSLPARGGLEANITRMTTFVRGMAGFNYQK